MAQNTAPVKTAHSVEINDRKSIKMTGVEDVGTFSETSVDIKTSEGTLIVRGNCLNISKLDTDSGELNICGEIVSLQYTKTKKKRSVIEGLLG